MSRNRETTLHIEWSPTQVTALDTETQQTATAPTLSALSATFGRRKNALVGVSRHLVFLQSVMLPKAAPSDLRRILDTQVAQIFPLPLNQMTYDFMQTGEQTPEGYLTLVAAMRTEELKRLLSDLQQAGIKATRIMPVALGATAVATQAGLPDAMLMERNAAGLGIDIVQQGVLRLSRTAPKDSDPISEAQRTLTAARSEPLPILSVGEANIPNAQSVREGALHRLSVSLPFHFELAEERVKAGKHRLATRMRQGAAMLVASLLLVTLIAVERGEKIAKIRRSQGTWARQLSKLRSIRDTETKKNQKNGAIAATFRRAFEPGQPLSDALSVIGDSQSSGVWLTGLTVERGKPLLIRGAAKTSEDIANYLRALGSQERLRDVRLIFANSGKVNDRPIVQFSVTAVAVGNLPMPSPEKQTRRARRATNKAAEKT